MVLVGTICQYNLQCAVRLNNLLTDKSLFKTQRRAHMDAIKTMLSIPSTEKQYDMLNLVTTKMMEVSSL